MKLNYPIMLCCLGALVSGCSNDDGLPAPTLEQVQRAVVLFDFVPPITSAQIDSLLEQADESIESGAPVPCSASGDGSISGAQAADSSVDIRSASYTNCDTTQRSSLPGNSFIGVSGSIDYTRDQGAFTATPWLNVRLGSEEQPAELELDSGHSLARISATYTETVLSVRDGRSRIAFSGNVDPYYGTGINTELNFDVIQTLTTQTDDSPNAPEADLLPGAYFVDGATVDQSIQITVASYEEAFDSCFQEGDTFTASSLEPLLFTREATRADADQPTRLTADGQWTTTLRFDAARDALIAFTNRGEEVIRDEALVSTANNCLLTLLAR